MRILLKSLSQGQDDICGVTVFVEDREKTEKKRLNVFFGDYSGIIGNTQLPALIGSDEYGMLEKASGKCEAYLCGLRIVSYGDNSRIKLKRKLLARRFSAEDADYAVYRIESEGLIDEQALITEYVIRSANEKYWGKKRIIASAYEAGFEKKDVEYALESLSDSIDFKENRRRLLMTKFGTCKPSDREQLNAMKRTLVRYGY